MRLMLTVKVDGKAQNILFNGKDGERKLYSFETGDKKLQDAIEKTQQFGTFYWPDPTQDTGDKEPVKAFELTVRPFDTINAAKDFLVIEMGVDKKKIPNPTSILNKGRELGYDIVIGNNNQ
jgi:hypothetical protein